MRLVDMLKKYRTAIYWNKELTRYVWSCFENVAW